MVLDSKKMNMYLETKRTILVGVFCCFCLQFFAQEREYNAEIGVLGGGAYYLGDANHTLFHNMTPAYGGLFRYRFDTRFAARAEFTRASIVDGKDELEFDNTINVFDVCGEFNFFDLENNPNRRFSRIFSPYIFVGLGAMNYLYEDNLQVTMSLPFGVGMKVKLGNRFNLNAQFSNRLLFADNLEGRWEFNNVYKLNGSNFLNNDMLSTLTIGITFDIWRKKCDCVGF